MRFLLLSVALLGVSAATYRNPVINDNVPDPGVLYWEGKWYLCSTTNSLPAFRIHVSEDLVNWEEAGYVFTEENYPKWVKTNYWAPEMHVINGHLNIYFTGKDDQDLLRIGVATAEHPLGPWKARDEPIASQATTWILDPTAMTDPTTGKSYLLYSNKDFDKKLPFEMYELSDDGLYTVGNLTEVLWFDQPWETWLIEGPHLVYRDGWFYIFYSGNGYTNPEYALSVARSKTITGPYENCPVPIFCQAADNAPGHTFVATGHGSIVQVPGTDVWYTINHAYWCGTMTNATPGRIVIVDRMWFGEDGWPYLGQCRSTREGDLPMPLSPEAAAMEPELCIPADKGTKFALEAYQGYGCVATDGSINGDCATSLFVAKTGFMGPRSISIESVEKPGHFMRHKGGKIYFDPDDGTDLFKQDATFFDIAGLADATQISFRSYNYPTNYMRHANGTLVNNEWDQTQLMAEDATFKIHYY